MIGFRPNSLFVRNLLMEFNLLTTMYSNPTGGSRRLSVRIRFLLLRLAGFHVISTTYLHFYFGDEHPTYSNFSLDLIFYDE